MATVSYIQLLETQWKRILHYLFNGSLEQWGKHPQRRNKIVLFPWYKNMLLLAGLEDSFPSKMSNLLEITYIQKLATSFINAYSKQPLVDPSWRVYPGSKSTECFSLVFFKPVKVKNWSKHIYANAATSSATNVRHHLATLILLSQLTFYSLSHSYTAGKL